MPSVDSQPRIIRYGKWLRVRPSLVAALAVLTGMCLGEPAVACGRGHSYMRGMQQMMVRSAQAQQKLMQAMQKQQEADEKAFLERFDTNHDGKITGKEKGPAKKYLRQRDLGINPDAKPVKLGKTTKSPNSSKP
jgi:hypothetical protein